MKEIGSNFEFRFDLLKKEKEFNILNHLNFQKEHYLYLSNGRAALKYILMNYSNKEKSHFLLPAYLCNAVLQPFKELNLNVDFYKVNSDLSINLEDLTAKLQPNTELILLIHYFGFPQPEEIMNQIVKLKQSGIKIIEDMTHSAFSRSGQNLMGQVGDYTVVSLRKWFAIPDGSILLSEHQLDSSMLKNGYNEFSFKNVIGQFIKQQYIQKKEINKKIFLDLFEVAENYFKDKINLDFMTDFSIGLLKRIDYPKVIKIRQKNYAYLFSKINEFDTDISPLYKYFSDDICPLGFPVITTKRNKLKKHLIKNKIYPPIHWDLPREISNGKYKVSNEISDKILTIPCDQRYNLDDMRYIIKKLNCF